MTATATIPTVPAVATTVAIDNFAKTIKQYSSKKVGSPSELAEQIQAVKTSMPVVLEEEKIRSYLSQRAKVIVSLVDRYIVSRISAEYPLIDEGLFKLQRHLVFGADDKLISDNTSPPQKRNKGERHLELPLFVHAPWEPNRWFSPSSRSGSGE